MAEPDFIQEARRDVASPEDFYKRTYSPLQLIAAYDAGLHARIPAPDPPPAGRGHSLSVITRELLRQHLVTGGYDPITKAARLDRKWLSRFANGDAKRPDVDCVQRLYEVLSGRLLLEPAHEPQDQHHKQDQAKDTAEPADAIGTPAVSPIATPATKEQK